MKHDLRPLPPARIELAHPKLRLARIAFEHRQSRAAYWESGDDIPYDAWIALQASQNGRWRTLAENLTGWSRPAKVEPARSRESIRQSLLHRKRTLARNAEAQEHDRSPWGPLRRAEFLEFMGSHRTLQRHYEISSASTYAANVRAGTSGEFTAIPYSRWRMWSRRWLLPVKQEDLDGVRLDTFSVREGV